MRLFRHAGTLIRVTMRGQGDKNPHRGKANWGAPSLLRKHMEKIREFFSTIPSVYAISISDP
jgi:hypothetical protein